MIRDRYSPWYVIVSCTLLLLIWSAVMFSLSYLLDFLLLLSPAIWTIVIIVRLGAFLYRHRWRQAVSVIAAPLMVYCLVGAWRLTGVTNAALRLSLWKDSYLADIASHLSGPEGQHFVLWPWGHHSGGIGGSPEDFETLVYDSTDQIALPRSMRTTQWYQLADASGYQNHLLIHPDGIETPEMFDRSVTVQPLGGHFYLCYWEI